MQWREHRRGSRVKRDVKGEKDACASRQSAQSSPSMSLENHWQMVGRVTAPLSPTTMCMSMESLQCEGEERRVQKAEGDE